MKVVHVLSYVSTDGAYGGPVAVARMQTEYLARSGHDVHLVAGWDGAASLTIPGVKVHLFKVRRLPGLGFAGMWSLPLWREVRRLSAQADVVHLHFARDLVQLPAAAASPENAALVLQAHGMIRPDNRLTARVLDVLLTRPAYRRAKAHLVLTPQERPDVARVEPRAHGRVVSIKNAVPQQSTRARWTEETPRVLFASRLSRRKRPAVFVDMAVKVIRAGSDAEFMLHGPDEGELPAVRDGIARHGISQRVAYKGALSPEQVLPVLRQAQVFVLPSINEPFPMAVLEAMSIGLPCVITDSTGISRELRERGAAIVTDGSAEELASAVLELLDSPSQWQRASDAAYDDIARSFSCEAVASTLEQVYEGARAAGRH